MTIVDDVDEPPELQKDMFWNQVAVIVALKEEFVLLQCFSTSIVLYSLISNCVSNINRYCQLLTG